jgi:polar amino acid transport system permease protein
VRRLLLVPIRADDPRSSIAAWAANLFILLALLALGFTLAFQQLQYHWNWTSFWRYRVLFLIGWFNTVGLALASLVLSSMIGVAMALLGRSRILAAQAFCRLYVELVRGTPLLVQILILFYVVAPVFELANRYLVGVLTLSLFAGAYITEIIRAGIESIGKSQWETARAIGLTQSQTYTLVVLPQAFRQILPPLTGQLVSLIKDSSLLSVIGISELSLNAQQVNALTYSTLESYLPLAIGYLVLTLPLSLWARHLERRAQFDT